MDRGSGNRLPYGRGSVSHGSVSRGSVSRGLLDCWMRARPSRASVGNADFRFQRDRIGGQQKNVGRYFVAVRNGNRYEVGRQSAGGGIAATGRAVAFRKRSSLRIQPLGADADHVGRQVGNDSYPARVGGAGKRKILRGEAVW